MICNIDSRSDETVQFRFLCPICDRVCWVATSTNEVQQTFECVCGKEITIGYKLVAIVKRCTISCEYINEYSIKL